MTDRVEKWTTKFINENFDVERWMRVRPRSKLHWCGSDSYKSMHFRHTELGFDVYVKEEQSSSDRAFNTTIYYYSIFIEHSVFLIETRIVFKTDLSRIDPPVIFCSYVGDPEVISSTLCLAFFGGLKIG